MDTSQCQLPKSGKVFDWNLHRFVRQLSDKFTLLTAERIDYAGNSESEIKQRIEAQKAKSASSTACPADKPYFDGITCINCEGHYPIFNIDKLRCTHCKKGTVWSEKDHSCVDS